MKISSKEQIKLDEGLRLKAYQCTGTTTKAQRDKGIKSVGEKTIGYGHNMKASPFYNGKKIPDTITLEMANDIFEDDYESAKLGLETHFAHFKWTPEPIQGVLINMAFQLGINGVMSFKNTLGKIARMEWKEAAAGMRASLWYKQTPERAERLAKIVEKQGGTKHV